VHQSFDQYNAMTHRERQDLETQDFNNAHFGGGAGRGSGGTVEVQQTADTGSEGSLLNQFWKQKNTSKKQRLDFAGRTG